MRAIRKRVTMVFQNGALFDSLSVRENVSFALRERGGLDDDQINNSTGLSTWWGPMTSSTHFPPASPQAANEP